MTGFYVAFEIQRLYLAGVQWLVEVPDLVSEIFGVEREHYFLGQYRASQYNAFRWPGSMYRQNMKYHCINIVRWGETCIFPLCAFLMFVVGGDFVHVEILPMVVQECNANYIYASYLILWCLFWGYDSIAYPIRMLINDVLSTFLYCLNTIQYLRGQAFPSNF